MLDARLTEIAPPDPFTLADFERYAARQRGRAAARSPPASRQAAMTSTRAGARDPAGLALALVRMLAALPAQAGAGRRSFPSTSSSGTARRGGTSTADAREPGRASRPAGTCARLARDRLAEAERRLKASPPAILPAFVPLGALRLDLDRLERNAARPFDPPAEASALRRQWAIWRWTRRF